MTNAILRTQQTIKKTAYFLQLSLSLSLILTLPMLALPNTVAYSQAQMEAAKPWLGVAIEAGKTGVAVTRVMPATPAAAAGLKSGDEITAVGDAAVKTPQELIQTVQAQGVGNTVTVHLLRAGKAVSQAVKLVARPDELEMLRQELVGKPAPAFNLPVAFGKGSGDSSKLIGKVAIVEFWATWCPACRSTHPKLSQFAKAHAVGSKIEIPVLAISDEDVATITKYTGTTQPEFTVLSDVKGSTQGPWFVSAIPELAVIDKTGKVAYATIGAGEYLDEALAKAEELAK